MSYTFSLHESAYPQVAIISMWCSCSKRSEITGEEEKEGKKKRRKKEEKKRKKKKKKKKKIDISGCDLQKLFTIITINECLYTIWE